MAKVILDQCDAGRHVSVDLDAYDELYENLKKAAALSRVAVRSKEFAYQGEEVIDYYIWVLDDLLELAQNALVRLRKAPPTAKTIH